MSRHAHRWVSERTVAGGVSSATYLVCSCGAKRGSKVVIKVDFEAHRHTEAVMREVLGPSAFVGAANETKRPVLVEASDDGMLPGMAAWKARYEAKRRAS